MSVRPTFLHVHNYYNCYNIHNSYKFDLANFGYDYSARINDFIIYALYTTDI